MTQFGPGTLKIGETGAEIDADCLVNSFTIEATADFGDPTYKLCGTSRPGSRKFTWQATGNLDVDDTDAAGLFALSQSAYGTEVPFTFTPNTAGGTVCAGVLILVPMSYGGEEYGADMTSDITWPLVDKPTFTYGAGGGGVAREIGDVIEDDARIEPEPAAIASP